jgi:hypothetical protein
VNNNNQTVADWLKAVVLEVWRRRIDAGVLAGYEFAFKDELRKGIERTQNPALRAKRVEILDCPVRDSRGQCRSFSYRISSALI